MSAMAFVRYEAAPVRAYTSAAARAVPGCVRLSWLHRSGVPALASAAALSAVHAVPVVGRLATSGPMKLPVAGGVGADVGLGLGVGVLGAEVLDTGVGERVGDTVGDAVTEG